MPNGTYTGSYAASVQLNPSDLTVTFASGSTVQALTGSGIVGDAGDAYTLYLDGDISAAAGYGVVLHGGGYVDNQAGGSISGANGIVIDGGGGTIRNDGYIGATSGLEAVGLGTGGSMTNAGTLMAQANYARAVYFADSATLSNLAGGTIVSGGKNGSAIRGGSAVQVINSGLIEQTDNGVGISVADGRVSNAAAGTISGGVAIGFSGPIDSSIDNSGLLMGGYTAIEMASAGTVTNESGGVIVGAYAAVMFDGGSVTNLSGGTISGTLGGIKMSGAAGTVVNDGYFGGSGTAIALTNGGTIDNRGTIDTSGGVSLGDGGSVTNETDGRIVGRFIGIGISNAPGSIDNAGYIGVSANSAGALQVAAGSSITNTGTVEAQGVYSRGIYSTASIGVTNGTSGTILSDGDAIVAGPGSTVVNQGLVEGTAAGVAIRLDGGEVLNADGASILGVTGVAFGTSAATLINEGRISGSGQGVVLGTGGGNVSNASTGTITGGNALVLSTAGTVTNAGLVKSTAAGSVGIDLDAGGTIVNQAHAKIVAVATGILIGGAAGSIDNAGRIATTGTRSTAAFAASGSDITNTGTIETVNGNSRAIYLDGVGTITNLASGTIDAAGTLSDAIDASGSVFLDNTGLIEATQVAIGFSDGGTIDNQAGARIFGTSNGIEISGSAGIIDNASYIGASAGAAIGLAAGSAITNSGTVEVAASTAYVLAIFDSGALDLTNTGTILSDAGNGAAVAGGTDSTVVNRGLIEVTAGGDAIRLAGGSVTNAAGGMIASAFDGVVLTGRGTVVNYGTIAAPSGDAVDFEAGSSLLIVEAGSTLAGLAVGDGGTLKLGALGGTGTLSGLGSQYTGFAQYLEAAAGTWTLAGTNAIGAGETLTVLGQLTLGGSLASDGLIDIRAGELTDRGALSGNGTIELQSHGTLDLVSAMTSGTIDFADSTGVLSVGQPTAETLALTGFQQGDRIDLTGVTYDAGLMSVTYSAGHLAVYDDGLRVADLAVTGLSGDALQVLGDSTGGTDIAVVCFVAGTRIRTAQGEVPVEALQPGDLVATVGGGHRPVRWIGRRRVDAARHGQPEKIFPVRIRAGAVADGVPCRDLLVSPSHALFLDGVLVPARRLVNGVTIVQDRSRSKIEYFHVELNRHDVLFAENLAAESYLECGNRDFFENGGKVVRFNSDPDRWCAELHDRDAAVVAIRRRLNERVRARGWRIGRASELRLEVDGVSLAPARIDGRRYRFALVQSCREFRLVSASARLADTAAGSFDERRLGVSVHAIDHVEGCRQQHFDLADAALFVDGWHGLDGTGDRRWRWTDGSARLPVLGPGLLTVTLGDPVVRWLPPDEHPTAALG